MQKMSVKVIVVSGLIAALYAAVTFAFASFSYQGVQFRVSEVLILLAFLDPLFIPAVTIGTFISNLIGPFGLVDAILGSATSLVAMLLVWQTRRLLGPKLPSLLLASLWPVILNALYVPALIIFLDPSTPWAAFGAIAFSVAIGEFAVVSVVGVIVLQSLKFNHIMNQFLLSLRLSIKSYK